MTLRIAAIATPAAPVASPDAWAEALAREVRAAAEAGATVAVLGEYATAPLAALDPRWEAWTPAWIGLATRLATGHRLHLLAGTHLVRDGDRLVNRALLVHPDGSREHQDKLHPTPWERAWGVQPTSALRLLDLGGARAAILTCYDIEFPEAARAAAIAGAELLLVPSWTDDAAGFQRVRRCACARAVENTLAVVHAPLVGALALDGFESAVGAAAVITPCDADFPPEGLAAAGGWNRVGPAVGDLDLAVLRRARAGGTVTPFGDRRELSAYRVDG
jgi:predicted amidohydrolase